MASRAWAAEKTRVTLVSMCMDFRVHTLLHIYEVLGEQLEHCAPDFMSVERLFFGRNITTAEFVWQARGVVMLLAARKG